MRTVSPVIFDFDNRNVTIHWKGKKATLEDQEDPNIFYSVQVEEEFRWNPKEETYFLVQLQELETTHQSEEAIPVGIQELITEYADLFMEPQGLPPPRIQDPTFPS